MPTAEQFAHHLRLLTLLTSACLTLPPLLNSPFLGADVETSIDDIPPSAADTFGAVIVLGEMLGRVEEASREKMRVGAGLIDALVLGRRISRRSYAGIWYAAEGVEVRVGRGDLSRSRRGVWWGSSTLEFVFVLLRRRKKFCVFWENDERLAEVGAGDCCGRNLGDDVFVFVAVAVADGP